MFNKNADDDALRERLRHNAERLEAPESYFPLLHAPPVALPQRVLFFHRRSIPEGGRPSFHKRHVLILNLRTAADVVVDEVLLHFPEGAALLIHPYQFHYYSRTEQPLNWLFVTFEIESDEPAFAALRQTPVRLSGRAEGLADAILSAYLSPRRTAPGVVTGTVLQLRLLLDELVSAAGVSAAGSRRLPVGEPAEMEWLRRVCAFVHGNLDLPIRIDDVARHVSLSPSHLRNLFRSQMGVGLGAYIRSARLHRACVLLETSENNVTEIAALCGFGSLYAFSRAFRNARGRSPTAYRRALRLRSGRERDKGSTP